jgi:hypothetical protein
VYPIARLLILVVAIVTRFPLQRYTPLRDPEFPMERQSQLFYAMLRPGMDGFTASTVHHDDYENVISFRAIPALTVFECEPYDDDFVFIRRRHDEPRFRVRYNLLQPVDAPSFSLGSAVRCTACEPPKAGIIHRIEWHTVRGHEIYYLSHDGRVSSRRYLPSEIKEYEAV